MQQSGVRVTSYAQPEQQGVLQTSKWYVPTGNVKFAQPGEPHGGAEA
jgi:hypothetical protein